MLTINIPGEEFWDETNEAFVYRKSVTLQLEHSLMAISKWESKWHKSFISSKNKTREEVIDYIKQMTINRNISDLVYKQLNKKVIDQITEYIENPMTATTFSHTNEKPSREIITSELVYYWMIIFNIPFECEKWNFNRLLTLIRVCEIKNRPNKKLGTKETAMRNSDLNKLRRERLNTKG